MIGIVIKPVDPLIVKGFVERIALLPLNYTRYSSLIVLKWNFCRTLKLAVIKNKDRIIERIMFRRSRFFFVPAHNLNESHIHPSTRSSALRTSPKSGGFLDISDWLSCVSNKLVNSWHVKSYT